MTVNDTSYLHNLSSFSKSDFHEVVKWSKPQNKASTGTQFLNLKYKLFLCRTLNCHTHNNDVWVCSIEHKWCQQSTFILCMPLSHRMTTLKTPIPTPGLLMQVWVAAPEATPTVALVIHEQTQDTFIKLIVTSSKWIIEGDLITQCFCAFFSTYSSFPAVYEWSCWLCICGGSLNLHNEVAMSPDTDIQPWLISAGKFTFSQADYMLRLSTEPR